MEVVDWSHKVVAMYFLLLKKFFEYLGKKNLRDPSKLADSWEMATFFN